ncbi:hypothetical protein KC357_g49 [Hortaea werneckii]|nr:hypothetical protein KC357_g49 [Hortaea werneckii]
MVSSSGVMTQYPAWRLLPRIQHEKGEGLHWNKEPAPCRRRRRRRRTPAKRRNAYQGLFLSLSLLASPGILSVSGELRYEKNSLSLQAVRPFNRPPLIEPGFVMGKVFISLPKPIVVVYERNVTAGPKTIRII